MGASYHDCQHTHNLCLVTGILDLVKSRYLCHVSDAHYIQGAVPSVCLQIPIPLGHIASRWQSIYCNPGLSVPHFARLRFALLLSERSVSLHYGSSPWEGTMQPISVVPDVSWSASNRPHLAMGFLGTLTVGGFGKLFFEKQCQRDLQRSLLTYLSHLPPAAFPPALPCITIDSLPAGSLLLESLKDHISTTAQDHCKAIYLHVLTTNNTAINFYENRDFKQHHYLPYYYSIRGVLKDGFTYVLYINGGHPPWTILYPFLLRGEGLWLPRRDFALAGAMVAFR